MTILGYKPAHVRKAIAGAVVGAAPLLVPDLADGHLSLAELGALVAAGVAGAAVIFGIPNAAASKARRKS